MFGVGLIQTLWNGSLERSKIFIVFGVQTRFFDKLPEPFYEIQIRRVGGQIKQFYVKEFGKIEDKGTFLISRIVQNKSDWDISVTTANIPKKITKAICIDIGIIDNRNQFMGNSIQCS